jgi:hypothetical protein
MHFAFASFVAVAVAVAAATLVTAQPRAKLSINPDPSVIRKLNWDDVPAPAPVALTNAKRFALNMPPLKPKTRRRIPHRGGPYMGTF